MMDVSGNHPNMEEDVLKDWDHMVSSQSIINLIFPAPRIDLL